jgi:membrane-bound serine protease (ClpP class)
VTIWWIILLFVAGVALVMSEFFVPGLILGTMGSLLLVTSAVVAVLYEPDKALFIIPLEILILMLAIAAGMYLMPRTRAGRALILRANQDAQEGWTASDSDMSLVGVLGEARTPLRPAGTIMVRNQRISAVAGGDYIEQGAPVRVVEVHGNWVVVERAE